MDITFTSILKMYYSQGAVYLGLIEDPVTNKKEKNLAQAKLLIDILTILMEKTKGNLNAEEESLINEIFTFLNSNYKKQKESESNS